MALFIPSRRQVVKPDTSTADHVPKHPATDHSQGWNQLRIREALRRLGHGDLGRFDETQRTRICGIIERVAGADGELGAAQTREIIRMLEVDRVNLGLDQRAVESLATFLTAGPTE